MNIFKRNLKVELKLIHDSEFYKINKVIKNTKEIICKTKLILGENTVIAAGFGVGISIFTESVKVSMSRGL